jgi:hypothetical protein
MCHELKMRSAQMKPIELKEVILKVVADHDRAPQSEAEVRFMAAVHLAALAFADEIRLGHPAPERRCMICNAPVSQCYC